MNAREELIKHIGEREVEYVYIEMGGSAIPECTISGPLQEVLPMLDFEYDSGSGGQELYGNIWYSDGTWSERGEYDESEWWEYKVCPTIPKRRTTGIVFLRRMTK